MCRAQERLLPEPGGQSATAWWCLLLAEPVTVQFSGMRDRGHFLQLERGTEGALPVDGAGDPEATSGCRCAPQEHGPSLWCSGGASLSWWFQIAQSRVIYINHFNPKPVGCASGRALAWRTYWVQSPAPKRRSFFPRLASIDSHQVGLHQALRGEPDE